MTRVVFADRGEPATGIENVMATCRHAILIVGVTVHERFDGDTEHVARSDQTFAYCGGQARDRAPHARANDPAYFVRSKLRPIRHLAHYALEIDMAREVEEHAEAAHVQRHPSARSEERRVGKE